MSEPAPSPSRRASARRSVRLIASDLDGTLFGTDGQLSSRTIAAVGAATAAGIEVVAATGRSHRTARPRLAPAEVITTAICSNGATVHDAPADEIVLHRPIHDGALSSFVPTLRAAHPEVALAWEVIGDFGWETAFIDLLDPRDRAVLRGERSDELHERFDDVQPVGLTKLLVAHPVLRQTAWLDVVAPFVPPELSVATSGADFVEITGVGVDKGSTLALLCDERGVSSEEVVVFGDHTNDLAMFAWAGRSVAVANADPTAKAAADEVIGHHADDAVATFIESLL